MTEDDRQDDASPEDRSDPAGNHTGGTSGGPRTGTEGRGQDEYSDVAIDSAAIDNRPAPSNTGES